MATEKMMDKSLSLTYEGDVSFGPGCIYLCRPDEYMSLAQVVHNAMSSDSDCKRIRCRIQLTIDRLPDDKLEVEVN